MDTKKVDMDKYRGEWLAWEGNKIIVHGKDLKEVSLKARKICKRPVFDKVPEGDTFVA